MTKQKKLHKQISIAFRRSNNETYSYTHSLLLPPPFSPSYAVCTSKPGNQKQFVFMGTAWKKRVPCANHTVQPRGPGNSPTPLSASITPHHCDGHKNCLRISQEKKVPLSIPRSSPHFLLAVLKNEVNSGTEEERERREGRTLHEYLQIKTVFCSQSTYLTKRQGTKSEAEKAV